MINDKNLIINKLNNIYNIKNIVNNISMEKFTQINDSKFEKALSMTLRRKQETGSTKISALPPRKYAKRFIEFITSSIK